MKLELDLRDTYGSHAGSLIIEGDLSIPIVRKVFDIVIDFIRNGGDKE